MVQHIKPASVFGRIGTGIGSGLAEQIPKEIERYRLGQGLGALEKESGGLTPLQQLTRLAAVPGAADRPQLIQSFSDLARHQSQANALQNFSFPGQPARLAQGGAQTQAGGESPGSTVPSIVNPSLVESAQRGYIPLSSEERLSKASDLFRQNPQFFGSDPSKALEFVDKQDALEQHRQGAREQLLARQEGIQQRVVESLQNQANRLSAKIPGDVYTQIEKEAIQAVKPKSEGGRGIDAQQASIEFGNKLDAISRNYSQINDLGGLSLFGTSANQVISTLKGLQKKFAERGDTRNFADTLQSNLGISPSLAYSIAQPVSQNADLNKSIKNLPKPVAISDVFSKGLFTDLISGGVQPAIDKKTLEISKKLLPKLGSSSPLAVGRELYNKGYNPDVWMDYVRQNSEGLSPEQIEQLGKTDSYTGTMGDWWLGSFTGVK